MRRITKAQARTQDHARKQWVLALMEGRTGTAAYFQPDLPTLVRKDRNSTAASGTRTPVAIKGTIRDRTKTTRVRRSRQVKFPSRARTIRRVMART